MNRPLPLPSREAAAESDPISGLRAILEVTRPDADVELIKRTYDVAAYWHQGQKRRSGDPYITHPLAVAAILAGLGADDETLCAALLHDTTEDTAYTLAALRSEFSAGIAAMVEAFTTLDKARGRRERKVAVAQAMGAAESGGTRVLAMKLADRLHNMRTLHFLPQEKQLRKSRETLNILVPVAQQLSMDTIKSELETLASAALERNRHARKASGRLLAATAALLPAARRTRWREEWLGELHTLPTRRRRAGFVAHTLLGVLRMALSLRRPPISSGQAR
jgi:(p)ppGpp synthase/HD superfamily hydrolase